MGPACNPGMSWICEASAFELLLSRAFDYGIRYGAFAAKSPSAPSGRGLSCRLKGRPALRPLDTAMESKKPFED